MAKALPLAATMANFTCQVCFEESKHRYPLKELKTGNGDTLRAADCNHPICRTCLGSFVTARVEDQLVFYVRCPSIGCTNELFEQDVKRLADAGALTREVADRFAELRARDFTEHAATLQDMWKSQMTVDNYIEMKFLWQRTRLCPRCSLVIEKSEGCNSFFCICGHHFDFASAPRVVGNGIDKFDQLITTAIALKLDFVDVEKYGSQGAPWRMARAVAWSSHVNRTAAETRLTREEAWQLLQQAKSGDEQAREKIRLARNRGDVAAEQALDEDFGFDLWENSSGEDEDVRAPIENSTIALELVSDEALPSIALAESPVEALKKLSSKLCKQAYVKAVRENTSEVQNASS